jgi:hypothetical protein
MFETVTDDVVEDLWDAERLWGGRLCRGGDEVHLKKKKKKTVNTKKAVSCIIYTSLKRVVRWCDVRDTLNTHEPRVNSSLAKGAAV